MIPRRWIPGTVCPGTRLVLAAMAALGCNGTPAASADPGGQRTAQVPAAAVTEAPMDEVVATFAAPDGRRSSFRLEVADTPRRREHGLMHRKSMDPDRGMVFVFPGDDVQSFWMKNTLIPLDMVFVESTGRVAGVVEDARPLTLEPRSVDLPSRYVVELNARTARAKGIAPGAFVTFEPPLKPVSR